MTTDTANSEREILDLSQFEGHSTHSDFDDLWAFGNDAAQRLAVSAPQLLAELTSLRACVSRKDEEIEVWRTCLAEIQQDGCGPEESMEDLWGRTLDRIQSAAIAAANATQPSGRYAEGREEWK